MLIDEPKRLLARNPWLIDLDAIRHPDCANNSWILSMFEWMSRLRGRIVAQRSEPAHPRPSMRAVEPRTAPNQLDELARILSEVREDNSDGRSPKVTVEGS